MAHQNHNIDNNDETYEPIDQWELECFRCHKPISADRPPNYNSENCSCVEVGTHGAGPGEYFSQPMIREQPMYHYDSTTHTYYHNQSPQSYASSNLSGPWPEGPEREDPNAHFTGGYLPLGPSIGLNEAQHRRTASFNSNLSFPMLRFLGERDLCYDTTEQAPTNSRFLSQDLHIQSHTSNKVQRGTKRSKKSHMSMQSSGSNDASFVSWGLMDPVAEAGAWTGERWDERPGEGYGYASALSGLEDLSMHDEH
jgi:hypothetical protein